MKNFTRREFIKISGAAGAVALGTGLASNFWGLDPDIVHDPNTDGDQVIPSFCEICFWKCGIHAHVKDGVLTKIVGNPKHPLSRGRLCPRGTGGMGLLYDPDRLKKPLVRSEKRGEQVFQEVDWNTALDMVVDKLNNLKKEHGPEALALYSHGFGGSWFKHLVKAYGTANIAAPSDAQCRGAREVAFHLTYGAPVGSPEHVDMRHSRVITLIGSHLGENMHNTQVQDFAYALSQGAELVVVDPRFSTAAGKARYWLPIKPGTDIALLLAWIHVIIKEKLYDRDYVEKYTEGFEELKKHVADKTPYWAFTQTTIEPEKIAETARFIAGSRPASLVHPGRRTAWYGNDTQRLRAMAILAALLGSYGRKGGFYIPSKYKMPKFGYPKYTHKPKLPADVKKGEVFPFADSVLAHGIRNASIPGTADYDIKAWMVYGCNLIQALPQQEETIRAIRNLDFIVSIDVLPSEIVGWSDVVLPEATYLERYDDLHTPGYREPYVALRQPVVSPMYDSKPGWWIAKELSKRVGLESYFPFENVTDYLETRLGKKRLALATLKKDGVILDKPQPLYFEDGIEMFTGEQKKIQLFSKEMEEAGLSPLPDHTPPEEPAPGEFRLLFGRSPVHTFGRTTNNRFLSEVCAKNVLWINKKIGLEMELNCGDRVHLINVNENTDGQNIKSEPVQVKLTQRIRPDCVYMIHGYGHTAKGLTFANGKGASDSRLMTKVKIDPVMGGTGMNVNFVKLEKIA